jgi:hypothetical protein
MSRCSIACTGLATIALAISAAAQAPATSQTPTPATPAASQAASTAAVTIEGCLVREQDVPGRKPNVVERTGIGEDYILISTKIVKGADKPTGTAGTAGPSRMYQVKGIDDGQLKPLVGKRVQVEGTLKDLDKPATPTPDAADLADIQGASIRQVTGECPAKP